MSGVDSKGFGGGGFTGSDGYIDCGEIIEKTILNSPNPFVLSLLQPLDILEIFLEENNGSTRVLVKKNELIAGSVTFAKLAELILCIQSGTNYVAIIDQISGGRCVVQIRPESLL